MDGRVEGEGGVDGFAFWVCDEWRGCGLERGRGLKWEGSRGCGHMGGGWGVMGLRVCDEWRGVA